MFHILPCLFRRLRKASAEMTMQRQLIAEECHETRIWIGFFQAQYISIHVVYGANVNYDLRKALGFGFAGAHAEFQLRYHD